MIDAKKINVSVKVQELVRLQIIKVIGQDTEIAYGSNAFRMK